MALLSPLDALRAAVLKVLGPVVSTLLRDRSLRVAFYAAAGMVTASLFVIASPVWAYALGPLIFGVPHLLADVRYLIVQPGLHRRLGLCVAVGAPLVLATFPSRLLGLPSVTVGLTAGLGAILFARASVLARAGGVAAWSLVLAGSYLYPLEVTLTLVHGHNFIAVALFMFVFARSRRAALLVGASFAVLSALLLAGALDGWLLRPAALAGPGSALSFAAMVRSLCPFADPVLGARLACLFVLAQSVHYAIWLRLVPEEARERPGIRSFSSSFRAVRGEVGLGVLVVAALCAVLIAARAGASLESARVLYLRAATFHAYLEISFIVLLILEGKRLLQGRYAADGEPTRTRLAP